MTRLDEILRETISAGEQFWFVQDVHITGETANTVTIHLVISAELIVQVFFSARSQRFSMALVGPGGRLYGRDRQFGQWHTHPFDNPTVHVPDREKPASQPVAQFLAEVEQILLSSNLLDSIFPP